MLKMKMMNRYSVVDENESFQAKIVSLWMDWSFRLGKRWKSGLNYQIWKVWMPIIILVT